MEPPLDAQSDLRSSPVGKAWKYKAVDMLPANNVGYSGRGRSRKRSQVYNNLSSYHSHFLDLITQEFVAEVSQFFFGKRIVKIYVFLHLYPIF